MSLTAVPTTAPVRASVARPPARARRGHLWQIDIVRLLTFAAVISVHSIAFTEQPANVVAAGAMMLLQFGREVFFALTGFVLVYSAAGRPVSARPFWRKRILYVAVPYLAWSGIYYAYLVLGPPQVPASLSGFGEDLLYGGAMYHLYFLLVTIQLYLAFPLLQRFVARTAHRAGTVLVAVSVANLAWFAVLEYLPFPSTGAGAWVFEHAYELLPTYSMYVLAGCYAATHFQKVQGVVRRHQRRLLVLGAVAATLALGVYAAQLPLMDPRVANDALQPAMALVCLAAVIVVYTAGDRWAEGRRAHQHTIEALSDASFGVYLAHPLILAVLLDYARFGNTDQALPAPLATVLAFVIAAGGATVVSLLARRTPLSLALTGRPWRTATRRPERPEVIGRHLDLVPPALASTGAGGGR